MKNSCYKCKFREVGCHSRCKVYQDEKAERDKLKEAIKREKDKDFQADSYVHMTR